MVETRTYAEELESAAIDKSSGFAPTCRGKTASVGVQMGFKLGAAWDRAWVVAWLRSQADVVEGMWYSNGPDREAQQSIIALRVLAADIESLSE